MLNLLCNLPFLTVVTLHCIAEGLHLMVRRKSAAFFSVFHAPHPVCMCAHAYSFLMEKKAHLFSLLLLITWKQGIFH